MFPAPKIPFLIIVLIVLGACKNSSTQEVQMNKKTPFITQKPIALFPDKQDISFLALLW